MNSSKQKILVIKLGALGDFIYALGAMKAIRAHHIDAHITLLTTKAYETLGNKSGYFNEIILDPRPQWFEFSKILSWRQTLNKENFSRVYDLQNNDRTALYFKLLNPKPEWVGAVKGASHQNNSPERRKLHAVKALAQTLAIGGIDNAGIDTLDWMTPTNRITLPENSVLMVAGSAPSRPKKRWGTKNYRDLCEKLITKKYHPVLLGTETERDLNSEISRDLPITNLTGQTTIYDLPALGKQSIAAIGNDTGPIHILSVTGMPLLALYNTVESNVKKHGPQGKNSHTLETSNLETLSVDTVLNKFLEIIN